jgi:hypothetical protein
MAPFLWICCASSMSKNTENSEIVPTPSACTPILYSINILRLSKMITQPTSQTLLIAQMSNSRLPMRSKGRCASSQSEMSPLSNLGISNRARPSDVERSPVYTTEVNTTQWCYREGPRPQRDDVEKFCATKGIAGSFFIARN